MKLNGDPSQWHERYVTARPFPHIVIDNLFPDEVLETVLAEFPKPDEIEWRRFDNATEKKLGYWHESAL
ncbi:MAG: 2OG-Fe(II) oxygenase, partial [Thermoanaerobaculia bacterium]